MFLNSKNSLSGVCGEVCASQFAPLWYKPREDDDESKRWNLYFNVSKYHVMHLGVKNPRADYTRRLDLKKIDSCVKEKVLGVTFDEKLSFDPHIIQSC